MGRKEELERMLSEGGLVSKRSLIEEGDGDDIIGRVILRRKVSRGGSSTTDLLHNFEAQFERKQLEESFRGC